MKKYYLFSVSVKTDRFYCGNIDEAFASDGVTGSWMSYQDAVNIGDAKVFDTRREAVDYAMHEKTAMGQLTK